MTRAVLDTSVLVSALISPRAAPADLWREWRHGTLELIVSPLLLNELNETLQRAKFRRYHSEDDARAFVEYLRVHAEFHADPAVPVGVTPDPDDDYLVGLARAARADVLVSGDRHLTELPNPDPPVLTPRAFADQLWT